jgi:predicted dehydrogenase
VELETNHCRQYKSNDKAELVAVCDINRERADKAATQYGVPAFIAWMNCCKTPTFEAVSVCTAGVENGGDHYEPTMQVLEAGKHTLTEKPISNNIEHAREMVAKAKRKGLKFGINLNHRFTPPPSAEEVANRWRVGRSALHQHGAVDQQSRTKARRGFTFALCIRTR